MIFKNKKNKKDKQARNRISQIDNQRVFSYYTASRKQIDKYGRQSSLNPDDPKLRNQRTVKSSLFIILAALVLIFIIFYLSVLSSSPYISIDGDSYRSKQTYQKLVTEVSGKDLRNRTKFFLQTEQLQKSVAATLPEASSVKISSTFLGHRPVVKIFTSKPLALFYQEGVGGSYILGSQGKILISNTDALKDYYKLPVIKNQSGIQAQSGMQFIRPSEAKGISDLIEQLKQDKSQFYLVLAKQPHELSLYEAGKGYYVKFLIDGDVVGQYGAMRATQAKLSQINQNPIEYIDVRLTDKVYYK